METRRSKSFKNNWSLRSKLLAAYGSVALATIILALIAIRGFSDTLVALESMKTDSIPVIEAAMELADSSSLLTAVGVAASSAQSQIELELELKISSLKIEQADFLALVGYLKQELQDPVSQQYGNLDALAFEFNETLDQLIAAKHQLIETRDAAIAFNSNRAFLVNHIARLQEQSEDAVRWSEDFQRLVNLSFSVASATTGSSVTEMQNRHAQIGEHLLNSLRQDNVVNVETFESFLSQQARVFRLKHDYLDLDQSIRTLVNALNDSSGRIRLFAEQQVTRSTRNARFQSQDTAAGIRTGRRYIIGLSIAVVTASFVAMLYVVRDLAGNLVLLATNMSRLAKGDHSVTIHGESRTDELGMLARAFRVFRDSSIENESLAQQLSDKSRTLEATFANMTDGLAVFDRDARLVTWNPQFMQINEVSVDTIFVGMKFQSLTDVATKDGITFRTLEGQIFEIPELLAKLKKQGLQFQKIYLSGKCVEVRSEPVPNGGFVASYTDLTDRRALEQKLNQSNRMEAIGKLTGGIAHDFNNMLAAITGNLQLLQEDLSQDALMSTRTLRALDAAERGASVTQRLLAFASQQSLEPKPVSINALVDGLEDLIAYGFDDRVTFETNLLEDLPLAFVDPGQLESALLNLVFNSRDAMPEGGTIKINTAKYVVIDKEYVSLSVIDSGKGMSPEILSHVYEPFFTTKNRSEGTGLGLSMVYGFAKQSGGFTTIESTAGLGTCVEIMLPISKQASNENDRPRPKEKMESMTLPGKTILIVEDDKTVRDTAFDLIYGLGYDAVSTGSYAEACELLCEQPFDLLFTDLMLPNGKTGIDVANFAKVEQPSITVVFSSGYAKEEVGQLISEWTDAILVPKPYRKQKLARCLNEQLRAKINA